MQIVIDIPEEIYKTLKSGIFIDLGKRSGKTIIQSFCRGIHNGTPLPKKHGDLITKEQAIELVEFYQMNPQHFDFVNLIDEIKAEKPIIEADKENQNDD